MAGTIRAYHGLDLVVNGETKQGFGSMHAPIHEVSITAGTAQVVREIVIPANSKVTIWEWAQTRGFELLSFRIKGTGYLRVAWQVKTVTSPTDETPNDEPVWNHASKSCVDSFSLDSDRVYTHATDATVSGDTAGEPSLWASGTKVNGVVSKVMVWNEDTTNSVTIVLFVVQ